MNTPSSIVQALLTQDLDRARQCLAAPGFDPLGNEVVATDATARAQSWLEIAITAPITVPDGLDPRASLLARSRSRHDRIKIIRALLQAGADPNATATPGAPSPLILAVGELGALAHPAAAALLDAGADPNAKSALHRTALHMAVLPNRVIDDHRLRTIKLLIASGANPSTPDDMKQTPMHWAIGTDYAHEVLLELHHAGGRWDTPDNRGQTPLDKLRANHPARVGWWEAYPGFTRLQDQVSSSPASTPGSSRRL